MVASRQQINRQVDKAIGEITMWVHEAIEENPELRGDIGVECDVITSYIEANVSGGEDSPMAKEIRRRLQGR